MASLKTFVPILAFVFVLFAFCEAKEVLVGGHKYLWKIPPSADAFTKWAGSKRFRVGDFLSWKYDGKTDSVLEVTKEDYESCNTSKPIKEFKDGNSKFELQRTGPFYFISGADGHCQKGQKVEVVVMSEKHKHGDSPVPAPAPAPAPSPSNSGAHALMMMKGLGLVGAIMGLGTGLLLI